MTRDTRTTLEVDTDGGVAHLRLTSPDTLNAMTRPFFRELQDVVSGLSRSGSTRALVISSTGRHFCAGMTCRSSPRAWRPPLPRPDGATCR